jgi:hypothetical protein
MLRHKTVLVPGAGASSEVKMPLGAVLKKDIASLVRIEPEGRHRILHTDDNRDMFDEIEQLEEFKGDKSAVLAASRQISAGVPFASSIDNFLEIRKDNPSISLLAKAAIVHLILSGERKSNLLANKVGGIPNLKPTAIDNTWYQEFAQLLFEKVGVEDIEEALAQLSVVDFNYDRCFEQVLFHAFTGLYNLTPARASELMGKVRIWHPYGSVGTLYWPRKDLPASDFGSKPTASGYLKLSKGLRTFTERMTDTTERDEMRSAVAGAKAVVFLGCAYHPQNLDLIHDPSYGNHVMSRLIFGTTYGMSEVDKSYVRSKLSAIFSIQMPGGQLEPTIHLVDARCADFLRQHKRSLSAD